jgi:hypothetical protein
MCRLEQPAAAMRVGMSFGNEYTHNKDSMIIRSGFALVANESLKYRPPIALG